jgi:isocitrate dehydrogenase kinase/phosphatase
MASFRESKEKIEAFLANPRNLASILPELYSKRFLSQQEELEISSTGPSRKAHTVTKLLENKIASQPELFVNLMKILQSHKFEEGGEAYDDHDDSDLPLGMTSRQLTQMRYLS